MGKLLTRVYNVISIYFINPTTPESSYAKTAQGGVITLRRPIIKDLTCSGGTLSVYFPKPLTAMTQQIYQI